MGAPRIGYPGKGGRITEFISFKDPPLHSFETVYLPNWRPSFQPAAR